MVGYGHQRDLNNTICISADLIFYIPGYTGFLRSSRELSVIPAVGMCLTDVLDQDRELEERHRSSWQVTSVRYSLWMKYLRVYATLCNEDLVDVASGEIREALLASGAWDAD